MINQARNTAILKPKETKKCACEVHLRVDKELAAKGQTPTKCLGHGDGCPCFIKNKENG